MDPEEGQYHSIEEADEAIRGLRAAYWLRLRSWAGWKLNDNCMADADDVIADVYERFIRGTRRWPIGVPIETCFSNAVRSAIDGEWDKHERRVAKQHLPVTAEGEPADPFENVTDPIVGRPMEQLIVYGPLEELIEAPERRRHQEIVEHIESSFAGDDPVMAVIIGLEQNLPARKVQDAFNLTETQYDSARRKLRRFINKHYQNRW